MGYTKFGEFMRIQRVKIMRLWVILQNFLM